MSRPVRYFIGVQYHAKKLMIYGKRTIIQKEIKMV
jgi:hypothetical protein